MRQYIYQGLHLSTLIQPYYTRCENLTLMFIYSMEFNIHEERNLSERHEKYARKMS